MKSLVTPLLAIIAVVSLLGNFFAYNRYSTSRPLVTVGSDVITKKQYQDQLEHQAGQEVMSKLVLTRVVAQAAAREGVTPSAQDIEDRMQTIERRAPLMLVPYSQDPAKMADFREELGTTIALENLRIKNIALTPSDVAAFYATHKTQFALPEQVKITTIVTQNKVDADTATDLLRQKQPVDVIGRQPRLRVVGVNGYNPNLETSLSPGLKKQVSAYLQKAKTGDIRTFRENQWFLTFQVDRSSGAVIPPLAQIRDQVERMALLEQAPSPQQEMARLYQATKPTFHYDPDKYAAYFASLQTLAVDKDAEKRLPAFRKSRYFES